MVVDASLEGNKVSRKYDVRTDQRIMEQLMARKENASERSMYNVGH